jgi:hypothetical protein
VRVSRRGKDRSTTSRAIADTFILARGCANGSPPKSPGFKCKRSTIAAGRENLRVTEEKAVVIGVGTPLYPLKSTILLKLRLKGLNIYIYLSLF